jgi:NAD(P) transhydrogenase subunit alpha
MSVTNTISGIVILGAIKIAGQTDNAFILFLSLSAIFLAAVNIAGGFTVSNRMLDFFKRKDKQ